MTDELEAAAHRRRRATEVEAEEPRRPAGTRKPFGTQEQRLYYAPRPGYRRYWFNDIPGRIERATEAGYTHVLDGKGKNVQHIVGKAESGGGLNAFLMEIPQEWYEEDMAAAQQSRDLQMAQITRGDQPDGPEKRYVPASGIRIENRR
jgi:hypothetical protein